MIEDTGADGLELNFGCPHGMSERGMGSAVGQVPEYIQQCAAWCKRYASVPVIVKLTPNITSILPAAIAAKAGGADAVSLINTLNSIMRVDYDTLTIYPSTDGFGSHGGYCGPAVKPIALHMVAEIARSRQTPAFPFRVSAASPIGAMPSISSRLARATCRSARRRWSTDSRSSTTWWTGSPPI
jgi:dihydropyrimidine dehydrogenase (NAD+) subunit PreA